MSNAEKEFVVTIRNAELVDIPEVFQMLKELTDSEKLPQNLIIDQVTFQKDYSEKAFNCLVAQTPNGSFVGYSVYCQTYSTWEGRMLHLRDLYVRPQQRGSGVGKKLFTTTMEKGYELGCKVAFFFVMQWNPAVKFYKELGAVNLTENENYHIFKLKSDNFNKICSN
ncbi:unnamed protein product [Psylliodes chrysocephalus]|uniref:N-acetyltransferase domain-containing protein n=1 Tax=Psylliodes chrysocephalus TaxID=3402493 RepID=A0A9P0CMF4_9CUCU|nr:unnamed protein product [Psylliodes chrysocephala]